MTRSTLVTLCVALGAAACGGAQHAEDRVLDTSIVQMHSANPIVTFRVSFSAGSANDPRGREGLTSLTADVIAEGGTRQLTYGQLVERLFPMAGEIGASVERDQTVFVGRVHRDKVAEFYELFRQVLLEPRFGEDDFNRLEERARTNLTLELRGNDDEELGRQALDALVYEGHPYGHPPVGTERGLGRITLRDVRAHRTRVFCRERAIAGIAGDFPPAILARFRDDLAHLPRGCPPPVALPDMRCGHGPFACDGPRVLLIQKDDSESTAISMGFPIDVTRASQDYAPLMLATSYLGQHRQFAGVLFRELRELRGLNYGDYAYSETFVQDGWSRFPLPNTSRRQNMFSIWIRPVRRDTEHFALRIAIRELDTFIHDGLSARSFDASRTFLSRYLALYGQTESRRLGYALDDVFYGSRPAYFERLPAEWAHVTRESVNDVVRRALAARPSLRIAIVTSDAEALRDAIASETASPMTYTEPKPEEVTREDQVIQSYALHIPRDHIRIVPVAQMFMGE